MVATETESTRLQEARQEMYRAHILDVAEEVFAEFGFEGTQVKMVAAHAQISLSTLYGRFPNKMELYRAVHGRRLEALMKRVSVVGIEYAGPLKQMLAAIEVYIGFHMEHPNYLKMHLREGNAWSQAHGLLSPEQRMNWEAGLKRMAKTFKAGMKTGVFAKDTPLLAARTTNAMHQVALSQWVDDGMRMKPGTVIARIHAQFIRAFCAPEKIIELLSDYKARS